MMQPPELYIHWLDELRNGEHVQPRRFNEMLRPGAEALSAFGVLADLAHGHWIRLTTGFDQSEGLAYGDEVYVHDIPHEIGTKVGLLTPYGRFTTDGAAPLVHGATSIAVLDFRGMPHAELADVIESNIHRLFEWALPHTMPYADNTDARIARALAKIGKDYEPRPFVEM